MFREWKAILKKPTFIIVMVGIALIPALYNIIFLSSMWDPYGKLSELPVAVVNKDQAASYNEESMNIGEDMVSNLKDNDALNFHFVTEEEGIEGLEDGTYYMVVTLPSDLSQKAASILTNHPEQMNIDYQTSSGHSFIASKMSDSAMVQLKQTVAKNVTETYTKALFEKMGTLKDGMEQASQGSQTLASGSNQLKEGSQQLADNLQTLAQSSVTFSNGAEQFTSGLTTYTDAVKKIDSGVASFHNGLLTYTGAVSQLDNGLNQLSSGVQAYTSGVDSLSSGASQLAGQSETLRNGVQQLNQGIQQLSSQLEASAQKSSQVSQLAAGLDQLNQAIQSANATESTALMGEVRNALSTIAASAKSVMVNSQASQQDALTAIQSTNAYSTLSAAQQAELTAAVSKQTNTSAQSAQEILSTIKELKGNLEHAKSQAESVAKLQSAAGQVLPLASSSLTQLSGGLGTLQKAVSQQLVPASQAIQSGVGTYTSGVDKVAQGAHTLSSKNSTLNGSVSQLASGSSQLAQKSSELVSGITTLQSGTSQLNQKSEQLLSGSSKLTNGSQKIAEGSEKLADGGNTLSAGLETLYGGVTTLSTGLMDANEQLALASTEETNAKTLSNPLALSKTDHDAVAVNGIAMAPYMISVALFVAALSTNMIFAKLPSGRHPETRWAWFKARLEINGIIAVLAGVLVYGGVHMIGLTAVHEMKTLLLILLASVTFMAMVTALTTWNSRVGAFFSLILLLLQLASSAGTYPLALTNDFFKSINPWLPMSYSVSGLRQTISMTGTIQEQVVFLIVTLIIFMGLGVMAYRPGVGEE